MDLSIISVNWNSVDYLRECISSIYDHTQGISFEIIVVDNASQQPGIDALKGDFSQITVIKSRENLGFSRANNLGFKHSTGRYVLFLNPDTKLISPAINVMLNRIRRLPDAGVVGCKLLNTDLTIQTTCIQKFPTILNQLVDIEFLHLRYPNSRLWGLGPLFSSSATAAEVEMISGACMLLDRDVFASVGMFSEEYFMYADDLDLCYKVKASGRRNYYVGDASVIHHGSKSSSQRLASQWAIVMKFKAMQQFCAKWRGPLHGAMYRLAMGSAACGRLLALTVLYPFLRTNGRIRRSAWAKWCAVLKWALGIEKWSLQEP